MNNTSALKLALVVVLAAAVSTCSSSDSGQAPAATPVDVTSETDARKYLLERVDDAAVVQVYADNFSSLPLREKMLSWHLYQAAIAGRDIFYDQRYANNLEMRGVLEAIVSHPAGIPGARHC